MKRADGVYFCLVLAFLVQSCVVTGPKYTHVESVLKLKPGMSKAEVNDSLGLGPYDLHHYDSTGSYAVIYKYRVTDRRTVPFLLKETNGMKAKGKYMDLIAYYDSSDVAYRFVSQRSESKLKESRLDINSVLTAVTITVPSILVYLGIMNSE